MSQQNKIEKKSDKKNQNNGAKDKNPTKKLAQTFLALTIFIFATYFAINAQNENSTSKNKSKTHKVLQIQIEQNNLESKLSEIQERILEKINLQPELIDIISQLNKISIKPQIKNEKIVTQIKTEVEKLFQRNPAGTVNMEVDVFDDLSEHSSSSADKNENMEYADSDSNIVLQISLFDNSSSNKIGELGVILPFRIFISKSE